jgi:hypothetical protein
MATSPSLNPEKALIFRITHIDNVPWMLDNGLHCRTSGLQDPGFVAIGNQDLIDKRITREVDVRPGGTLSDYIPFYFTPYSPMLLNIKTGWGDVLQRRNEEIVILVSSLWAVQQRGLGFVFSDRHAYLRAAQFTADLGLLPTWVPWDQLQRRDFKKDVERPDKVERYQAEALIHHHVPADTLLGIACYSGAVAGSVQGQVAQRGLDLKVVALPGWYF